MKILSVHSDYQGTETVAVGNGKALPILKTGSSIGHTPTSSFKLTNILRVPEISTNLLFVHQFTKDNDCVLSLISLDLLYRIGQGRFFFADPETMVFIHFMAFSRRVLLFSLVRHSLLMSGISVLAIHLRQFFTRSSLLQVFLLKALVLNFYFVSLVDMVKLVNIRLKCLKLLLPNHWN